MTAMFQSNKKKGNKKRPEISLPSNFEHRVHTGYDTNQGTFVGLPSQWSGIVEPSSPTRPKPIIDPSQVTNVELEARKVRMYHFLK